MKPRLEVKKVCEVILNGEKYEKEECFVKSRKRELVFTRQLCMYFSCSMTNASLAKIGEYIGGKDHATVLHAKKTINNLIDTDRNVRKQVLEYMEIFEDLTREIVPNPIPVKVPEWLMKKIAYSNILNAVELSRMAEENPAAARQYRRFLSRKYGTKFIGKILQPGVRNWQRPLGGMRRFLPLQRQ
jgi:hypothetical protein